MNNKFSFYSLAVLLAGGLSLTSCKDKKATTDANTTTTTTVDTPTTYTAPVEVSADEPLRQGVADATKDFPGVSATVTNGEVNVSGEIARADWMRLKPMLDALNPKKVNNQLTIK
ncbi:MAG: hypothetical protein WKF70_03330 [Chitinophagaceae bacterium]